MTTLNVAVYAFTGPTYNDGLAFKYKPLDAVTARYLDDTGGNITTPPSGTTDINFHLKSASVSWPDKAGVKLSFSLGSTGQDTLKVWDPAMVGTPLPSVFTKPVVKSDTGAVCNPTNDTAAACNMVSTTVTPDGKTYNYSLSVGATPSGSSLTVITVDPRIHNGGVNLSWPSFSNVVAFTVGILLTVAAYAAWKSWQRRTMNRPAA